MHSYEQFKQNYLSWGHSDNESDIKKAYEEYKTIMKEPIPTLNDLPKELFVYKEVE